MGKGGSKEPQGVPIRPTFFVFGPSAERMLARMGVGGEESRHGILTPNPLSLVPALQALWRGGYGRTRRCRQRRTALRQAGVRSGRGTLTVPTARM